MASLSKAVPALVLTELDSATVAATVAVATEVEKGTASEAGPLLGPTLSISPAAAA